MKANLLVAFVIAGAVLAEAATNEVPTFTITAADVIPSSIYMYRATWPPGTNRFTVKFQYSETGSNRARAFTEAHRSPEVDTCSPSPRGPAGFTLRRTSWESTVKSVTMTGYGNKARYISKTPSTA